jgi:N-acyl-D-amino-acid deacylase
VTVQIAHIKLKIEKSWGKLHLITEPIENARHEGIAVFMDEYPYTAGSTGFTSSFPEWAVTDGHEAFKECVENPENYKKIKNFIIDFRFTSSRGIDKSKMIYLTRNQNHPEYEGKNLAEILELLGREQNISNAADLFIELEKNDRPNAIFFQTDEKDVIALMQKEYTMVGSDGGIQIPGKEITHPRAYGTFPKIISQYVREKKALTLPDAVRKMTSLPAKAMGFKERGIVKENWFADLVIFDFNTIAETATYKNPHQYPEGIQYVIVNGEVSVQNGKMTGVKAGKILYGKGKN